uniref:Ribonuclease H protein At1g65750 family n=1 Tax=Cajanus cajan TaxID=3821 RepID=A0A151SH02_CAJCA|nr:Putative ribonuclease H protein At1g65750 family [Cajanus cajan]
MDKVNSKLSMWKSKLLNKPGRVTLANAVLFSLPAYGMQILWYPQSICNFIDRSIRSFIWKESSGKVVHMVRWDMMKLAKKLGGLGLHAT